MIGIIVGVAGALTLYPFVYVFSMSVSDPLAVMTREIWLLPKGFQLESYRFALKSQSLIRILRQYPAVHQRWNTLVVSHGKSLEDQANYSD